MPKAIHVTVAKPKKGGAVFRAPLGTPLPTSATEDLNEAFKDLGYISTDGVVNSNSPESESISAWGGDVVYTYPKSKTDTFKMKLIEALNTEVLKTVYGNDNVTGDLETGLSIQANNNPQEASCFVIDTILRGNVLQRLVLPNASVTAVGDITYADGTVLGYETTLTAALDDDGNTHYDYRIQGDTGKAQKPAASESGVTE